MFVWSGPNAIIRSTFSTEWRKSERAGKRDEDHDEGLALQTTRGQIFFSFCGGVEMKEETAELWNLGEMIGEQGGRGGGVGGGAGPNASACKCFSFIKSHLSACQRLRRDGSAAV